MYKPHKSSVEGILHKRQEKNPILIGKSLGIVRVEGKIEIFFSFSDEKNCIWWNILATTLMRKKQVKQSFFDIMEEIMICNFLGHLSAWNGPAVS